MFFFEKIIAYRPPFPPSLGSCKACSLLQSHFSISSWQCCRCVVSHRFHQFGHVFSTFFHLNASEDLSTPNSFPLPEGSRRYLGAVADDVGVAAAEADSCGCGFVFGIARYLNSFATNEL